MGIKCSFYSCNFTLVCYCWLWEESVEEKLARTRPRLHESSSEGPTLV